MTAESLSLIAAATSVVAAIATALMALATLGMAQATRETTNKAAEGLLQADRHHRENLRPFCLIDFLAADETNPFGPNFKPRPAFTGDKPTKGQKDCISIVGKLHNKGAGPAKNVVVYLNWGASATYMDGRQREMDGAACWLTHPVVIRGVIGAGETIEPTVLASITERNVIVPPGREPRAAEGNLEWVATDAYEVVLQYEDMFGQIFRTVHPKGIPPNLPVEVAAHQGDRAKWDGLAVRPNKPLPVFLEGAQPMRTLADIPPLPRLSGAEVGPQEVLGA